MQKSLHGLTLASLNTPDLTFTKFYPTLTRLLRLSGNFNAIAAHPVVDAYISDSRLTDFARRTVDPPSIFAE